MKIDSRIKLKEVRGFFSTIRKDYKSSDKESKKMKRGAFISALSLTFNQVWSGILAPLIYPIWWIFRKQITEAVYKGSSWQEVHKLVHDNKIAEAKKIVQRKGKLIYWLWTFGDLKDPLGRGELPDDGYRGRFKNNFIGRFYENAIRNPRFTINYMNYRTGTIVKTWTPLDTRDWSQSVSSEGLGDSPIGVFFKWFIDEGGKWTFIYEDNNKQSSFYFGWCGLSGKNVIGKNGRFEIGYRPN